jgi:hypothetical protein
MAKPLKNGDAKLKGLQSFDQASQLPNTYHLLRFMTTTRGLGGIIMWQFVLGVSVGSIATLFCMSLMFVAKRADRTMDV